MQAWKWKNSTCSVVTGHRNKGQEIAQNDLAKFGDQIEVVFCNNDDMAIGALQAIQAAGRTVNKDIYLVGVDALDAALNEVVNGNLTGTVLNDAQSQASQADNKHGRPARRQDLC